MDTNMAVNDIIIVYLEGILGPACVCGSGRRWDAAL